MKLVLYGSPTKPGYVSCYPRDRRRPSDAESQSSSGAAAITAHLPRSSPSLPPVSFFVAQHTMDKLVAQYSRQPDQNEFYSEQEQQDLTESLPPLSLKFSLPPVDNVSFRIPALPLVPCDWMAMQAKMPLSPILPSACYHYHSYAATGALS